MFEKGFFAPLVVEEPKKRSKIKRLALWEKTWKMKMVRPGFRSSPGGDTIIVVESLSKHGHLGLRGASPDHMSTELAHVGRYGEIFGNLIRRNKVMQHDSNYGPFIN